MIDKAAGTGAEQAEGAPIYGWPGPAQAAIDADQSKSYGITFTAEDVRHKSYATSQVSLHPMYCPGSVIRSHDEGSRRDGRCVWCERKFKAKAMRPNLAARYVDELDLAYRRVYDPDYGVNRSDY